MRDTMAVSSLLGRTVRHAGGVGVVVAVAPEAGVVRVQAGSRCWFLSVEQVWPADWGERR